MNRAARDILTALAEPDGVLIETVTAGSLAGDGTKRWWLWSPRPGRRWRPVPGRTVIDLLARGWIAAKSPGSNMPALTPRGNLALQEPCRSQTPMKQPTPDDRSQTPMKQPTPDDWTAAAPRLSKLFGLAWGVNVIARRQGDVTDWSCQAWITRDGITRILATQPHSTLVAAAEEALTKVQERLAPDEPDL